MTDRTIFLCPSTADLRLIPSPVSSTYPLPRHLPQLAHYARPRPVATGSELRPGWRASPQMPGLRRASWPVNSKKVRHRRLRKTVIWYSRSSSAPPCCAVALPDPVSWPGLEEVNGEPWRRGMETTQRSGDLVLAWPSSAVSRRGGRPHLTVSTPRMARALLCFTASRLMQLPEKHHQAGSSNSNGATATS